MHQHRLIMDIKKNNKRGILLTFIWIFSYVIYSAYLTYSLQRISVSKEIFLWLKNSISLLCSLFFFINYKFKIPSFRAMVLYGIRSVITVWAIFAIYKGYSHLPLGLMTAIGYTEGFMKIALADIWLQEKCSLSEWFYTIIGYIGILCIIYGSNQTFYLNKKLLLYIGHGLLGNFLASIVSLISKQLLKIEPFHHTIVYGKILVWILLTIYSNNSIFYYDYSDSPITLISAFFAGIMYFFISYFYNKIIQTTSFSIITTVSYLRFIFYLPIGYFIFGERQFFSTISLLGFIIVMFANLLLLRRQIIPVK